MTASPFITPSVTYCPGLKVTGRSGSKMNLARSSEKFVRSTRRALMKAFRFGMHSLWGRSQRGACHHPPIGVKRAPAPGLHFLVPRACLFFAAVEQPASSTAESDAEHKVSSSGLLL